jgi:hypothetical protein
MPSGRTEGVGHADVEGEGSPTADLEIVDATDVIDPRCQI